MIKEIFILPIKFYQRFISPLIAGKACCRFTPTCSEYMVEAIKKKGVLRGITIGIYRILRCNPWNKGGYDPINNDHIKNK